MSTITGNPLLIAAQLAQGQARRDREAAASGYAQTQAQGAPVKRAGDAAARITLSPAAQAMTQAQQAPATRAAAAPEPAALQPAYRAAAGQREAPLATVPKPAYQRPGTMLDIVI